MNWLNLGLSASFIFGFARWRWPIMPKWFASSGIAIGIGFLLLSFMPWIRPGPAALILAAFVTIAIAVEWQIASQPDQPKPAPVPAPGEPARTTQTNVVRPAKTQGVGSMGTKVIRQHEQNPPAPVKKGEDRAALLQKLTQLYMASHDGISSEMMAGLEYPPAEYLNAELAKRGERWRVKDAGLGKVEIYDLR